ncbi:MAG: hypothetical protein JWN49_28 [Parcubacteria group bacterium]|nr:hypothetical protein [Parcubacteria group bacterium]
MRIAIIATVLSASFFSVPANVQSVTYVFGPEGSAVISTGGKLTDQDIKNFESDRNYCDKRRFEANAPYVNLEGQAYLQGCMEFRLGGNFHEPSPEWHESATEAAQLCANYVSNDPFLGSQVYRVRHRTKLMRDCVIVELNYRR